MCIYFFYPFQDVLHGRKKQLEERQKMIENSEKEKEEEIKAWKLITQNNHQLEMKQAFEKQLERKQYAIYLKNQMEENRNKKVIKYF